MNRLLTILFLFASCALIGAEREQDACLDGRVYRYTIKGMEGMLYHWRAENGTIMNKDTLNDTILIRWNNLGTYKLSVFGEYDGCFTDWKEMKVKLHGVPYFSLGENVTLCEGESYTFKPDFGKVSSVNWRNGTVGTSLTVDSTQKVWASILDEFGCRASDTVQVDVRKLPYINLGPDTMLCGDQKLVLNSHSAIYDGTIYEWRTPNPNEKFMQPSIEVGRGEAVYSVKATDMYGCESYDSIKIFKCSNVFDRNKISIAFTPNGDTYNDFWEIQGLADEYPDAIIDVYDRGGRLVYRSDKGYTKPWDGRDKGNNTLLPIASYYYIIYLNNQDGDKIPGTLNIIR